MFIGHYGLGMGAKKLAPQTSLGTLLLATNWIDLIWPFFLLLGWESVKIVPGITKLTPFDFHYPYSHSLSAVVGWALLLGGIHFFFKKNIKAAIVIGLLVVSHWFLDFWVHRPDMPLFINGGPFLGLGFWNSWTITLLSEFTVYSIGLAMFLNTKRKPNRWFWALATILPIFYIVFMFSPPPPNQMAVALTGFTQWLIVGWGYLADRDISK
jgi:hypothetical protein